MSTEKDTTVSSDITEQPIKENNNITSELVIDKEIDKGKINKKLSEFEINDLIKKNEKLSDEVKNLKNQIVSLNDKRKQKQLKIHIK